MRSSTIAVGFPICAKDEVVQRQRLTSKPSTQVHAQSSRLIDTTVWEKLGKPDVPSYGAWEDWKRVMLPRIGQPDKKDMKNSAVQETTVTKGSN